MNTDDVGSFFETSGSSEEVSTLNEVGPTNTTLKTFSIPGFKDAIDDGTFSSLFIAREDMEASDPAVGKRVLEVLVCFKVTLVTGSDTTGVTVTGGDVDSTNTVDTAAGDANYKVSAFIMADITVLFTHAIFVSRRFHLVSWLAE